MTEMRYTKDHEWIRLDGDTALVGITEHAQSQLGDVVYVELPEIGKSFAAGDEAAVVESVKAASEVYAPAGGEVVAVNAALADTPATVNEDAEGKGWFLKLKLADPAELEKLMTVEQYKDYVATLS
ncbi:MAG TPA: glycine cleavage system protein GcvH [Xanthobacteraceae bacterium]|nr:glycine cleavage system protein GcvH [Xanthobacteraceae bacterium]